VQRPEAVVGGRWPPTLDHVDDVVLDVGGGGVRQAAPALAEERAELFERLEVGLDDGAPGLALCPQGPLEGAYKGSILASAWAEGSKVLCSEAGVLASPRSSRNEEAAGQRLNRSLHRSPGSSADRATAS
jgi:hypothetical protein